MTGECNSESNFRSPTLWETTALLSGRPWASALSRAFAAAGLVRGSDANQLNFNATFAWANDYNGANNQYSAFDSSTSTSWSTTGAPSASNVKRLYYDAGADRLGVTNVQNTATQYKIYFNNVTTDPAAWTVDGSNDLQNWTTLDTQIAQSAGGAAGYKTYPIVAGSQAAYRIYRLSVTANNGGATLTVYEWQLFVGAVQVTAPVQIHPTSSAWTNLEIFRFADALQATLPVFIKIGYLNTGYGGVGLWIQVGTGSDGSGNLTGQVSVARQISNNNNAGGQGGTSAFSGAANRLTLAHLYDANSQSIYLSIQRTKDASGNDTADGICLRYGQFGGNVPAPAKGQLCVPASGGVPAWETDWACVMPTTGTGLRGLQVSVFPLIPFVPSTTVAMPGNAEDCNFAYFDADLTAGMPVQFAPVAGGPNRTYFPIGNTISGISRGNVANITRLMMIWE